MTKPMDLESSKNLLEEVLRKFKKDPRYGYYEKLINELISYLEEQEEKTS